MKEENKEVEMLNGICFWLIKQCRDTNAEKMTIKQDNVTEKGVNIGSWEIKVKKLAPKE